MGLTGPDPKSRDDSKEVALCVSFVLITHSHRIQTWSLICFCNLVIYKTFYKCFEILWQLHIKKTLSTGFQMYLKISCKAIRRITKYNLNIIVLVKFVN